MIIFVFTKLKNNTKLLFAIRYSELLHMKNLSYLSLKIYCRIALKFYFKKWQVRNIQPVPEGAVIFVANHQNAFLDAVVLGCSSHHNPWFLTRANVFQKPLMKKIFNTFKMTSSFLRSVLNPSRKR